MAESKSPGEQATAIIIAMIESKDYKAPIGNADAIASFWGEVHTSLTKKIRNS